MIAFGNKLASAERRARQRVLVRAVLAAALAGAVGLLLVALVGIAPADGLGALAGMRDDWLLLAIPAAAAIIAFVTLYAMGRARLPDALDLAQNADRRFGFKETVSTVTELDRRGQVADSAVLSALYRSAEQDGARIDPAALVPITLPRLAVLVPVFLLATSLVLALTPGARLAEQSRMATAETAPQTLAEEEREQVRADIARVTQAIDQQTESLSDEYMEAVARTLESLSERLATDPGLTRAEIAETLDALAMHAESATGNFPSSMRQQISEVLDTMADELERPRTEVAEAGAPGENPGANAEGVPPEPGSNPDGEQQVGPALEQMLDAMEANQQNLGEGFDVDNDLNTPPVSGNYMDAARERNQMALEQAAEMSAEAQLMGASSESQAGESRLAGQGSDELDMGGAEIAGVEFETSDELLLEADPSGEGRRFEMDLPPEADFSAVDRSVLLPEGSNWTYTPGSAASRNGVGLVNRDAVSVYLQALTNQTGTDSEVAQ